MKTVLVTASTLQEISLLTSPLGTTEISFDGAVKTFEKKLDNLTVILSITGIGKVNAASACTALIRHFKPGLIVNAGCAGAFPGSGMTVGDLAIATTEIYGDEGVLTPDGWQPMDLIGIPLATRNERSFFNEFPLSLQFSSMAMKLADGLGVPLKRGKFVTVSTCSGTLARGEELHRRFGALCENMEGAAVAHVAMLYGVDCMELRGISNLVEDRDLSGWNIPLAVERAQRFLLKFIEIL
ncbi:MAG: futalosine hydrolase [Geobacter sp.]|nr:futalosine hydrolase [Geobacter sp.]